VRQKRIRVAIFTTHPIQYQAPLFRHLADDRGLDPVVFFGSRHGLDVSLDKGFGTRFQWDIPLLDGYEHQFVENVAHHPDVDSFFGIRLHDAHAILRDGEFDACIVLGWQTVAHLQMMRASWRLGIPLVVRGESNLLRRPKQSLSAVARKAFWLPLRDRLYAALFRRVSAFAVIGTRNAEYYRHFGVSSSRLFWAPYAVDNEHFALTGATRQTARATRRSELGANAETTVFVSVAKLLNRKRPLDLLAAFAACVKAGVDAHLAYVGDGPERAKLEAAIDHANLASRVTITGFVNQASIPEWYAAADCLVLPSDSFETWGLAVNEGMAAGLPVIVSDAAGCAPDLIDEGANGFAFPLGDTAALADRLRRMAEAGVGRRARMGSRSQEIVSHFTLRGAADAIAAATIALVDGRRHAGSV
jgi:glycosyltransferase involved in cell wall biosynthesis